MSLPTPTDSNADDADLYGMKSAAEYLGLSYAWMQKLVTENRIRYWRETPPTPRADGSVTVGSDVVFKREWLDAYRAERRKPGRPKGAKDKAERKRAE